MGQGLADALCAIVGGGVAGRDQGAALLTMGALPNTGPCRQAKPNKGCIEAAATAATAPVTEGADVAAHPDCTPPDCGI